ncbi:hypothetical protein GH714_002308 [Hevea brasiliensis]|uniref:TIR domain-containing protein n=1 Tax=Hevea brasiliensis TaxID=3981 RepID=A0A6A6KM98_HEVBR|nr:hypothetical protein GH714_002308 [Hevea brasiliensis]
MSSSSKNSNWTCDVFLSFRGSDVRKGFIGHLYAALCRDGIQTFLDEDKIDYGQEIGLACIKGIQESNLSLIILSKDYASSTWCLEELDHILKCKQPDDIWPIFYDVDPSDVENVSGSYGDVFREHEKRFKEDVLNIWKDNFQKVCNLKRPDLQKHLDGHEAKYIDHIVKEILKRLNRTTRSVAILPVGLNYRANENLPESIGGVKALEELNMSGCIKFEEFPESIGLLTHLIYLNLQGCKNLKELPRSIGDLNKLNISGCLKLKELPSSAELLN